MCLTYLRNMICMLVALLVATGCQNDKDEQQDQKIVREYGQVANKFKKQQLKYKVALFDLEGTLIDSSEAYAKIVSLALKEFNEKPVTAEKIRLSTGNGLRDICQKCFPEKRYNEFENFYKAVKKHEAEYIKKSDNNVSKAHPGAVNMIKNLQERGVDVYIITNRDQDQTMPVLDKIFPGVFDKEHVVSPSDPTLKKPNPQLTIDLIKKLGVDKKNVVFVGDTDVDIKTAHGAGIDVLSVDWGTQTRTQLKNVGGKNFPDNFNQLEDMIVYINRTKTVNNNIVAKAA